VKFNLIQFTQWQVYPEVWHSATRKPNPEKILKVPQSGTFKIFSVLLEALIGCLYKIELSP
jgi:hypothetical protein